MPMQIALRPNPRLAMLQGEPGVSRSLIRPFEGFASYQKNRNAEYWIESSSAAVFWARAGEAQARSASRMTSVRLMGFLPLGLERQSERHAVSAAEPALIGPRVVHAVSVGVELAVQARPDREPDLRLALDRVLVAEPERQQVVIGELRARAHALGVVAGMERVERQPQLGAVVQAHRQPHAHAEQHRQRKIVGELL